MTGYNDEIDAAWSARVALLTSALAVAKQVSQEALHRSFPEAGDGRAMPPMGDELMTAGLNADDARFVAVQLAQNGLTMVPTKPLLDPMPRQDVQLPPRWPEAAEITSLRAEVAKLDALMRAGFAEYERRLADAEAERDRLRETVRFYASESLWDRDGGTDGLTPMERDGGTRARAALTTEEKPMQYDMPDRIWARDFGSPKPWRPDDNVGGTEYIRADPAVILAAAMELPEVKALIDAAHPIAFWTIGEMLVDDPKVAAEYPHLSRAILDLRAALAALTTKGDADE